MVSGGHARVKHNFECDDVECKFMSLQMYMVMAQRAGASFVFEFNKFDNLQLI